MKIKKCLKFPLGANVHTVDILRVHIGSVLDELLGLVDVPVEHGGHERLGVGSRVGLVKRRHGGLGLGRFRPPLALGHVLRQLAEDESGAGRVGVRGGGGGGGGGRASKADEVELEGRALLHW